MNYLPIPGTSQKLSDGDLVMLVRFPNIKWVVHYGRYMYDGQQYLGWYFLSVPSQTVMPITDYDLRLLTVVSASGPDKCPNVPPPTHVPPDSLPGHHPGHHPGPRPPEPQPGPVPFEVPFTKELKENLDAAFISVETRKDLEMLKCRDLPNGKLVRVNNGDGPAEYFVWLESLRDFAQADITTREEWSKVLRELEQTKALFVWGKISEE